MSPGAAVRIVLLSIIVSLASGTAPADPLTIWVQAPVSNDRPELKSLGRGADSGEDDTRDLVAASDRAVAEQRPLVLTRNYRLTSNTTINADLIFRRGSLSPDRGVTITLSGAVIDAPHDAWVFKGAGAVVVRNALEVWTAWWGALANSRSDFAPSFRAALGSNRTVHSVPATYVCGSLVHSVVFTPFPTCVNVDGYDHLTLDNGGSVFQATDAVNRTVHAVMFFSRDSNLTINGGDFVGDVAKLSAPSLQSSVAVATHDQVNVRVTNMTCSGNWGGVSACLAGDYVVNGYYGHITARAVGQCTDFAFFNNTVLDDLVCTGADITGEVGPSHTGSKGVSLIYDTAAVSEGGNQLPPPYAALDTNHNVEIRNSHISGFNSCIQISAGNAILSRDNELEGCAGNVDGAQGVGLDLAYDPTSSMHHPLTNFRSIGDHIHDNGTKGAGFGVSIGNGSILNDDVMSNIKIASVIENNNRVGINASGLSHLVGLDLHGSTFISGTRQRVSVGENVVRILTSKP